MKNNKRKPVSALNGASFTELTSQDARRISGGNNPGTSRYAPGPNGEGCTPPLRPAITLLPGVLVSD